MRESDDLLRKLEPQLRERAKSLWYLGVLSQDSKSEHFHQQVLRLLADKHSKIDYRTEIRLPPPTRSKLQGQYELGEVIYPDRPCANLGLTDQDLLRHVLIVGMTGAGKTNLAIRLLEELARQGIPFLVFDWKRSYSRLAYNKEFSKLKIIRLGDKESGFRFNPLIPPPGINPKHWQALFIDICKHAFFLGHGVEYFMRKAIDELYGRYQVYDGGTRRRFRVCNIDNVQGSVVPVFDAKECFVDSG